MMRETGVQNGNPGSVLNATNAVNGTGGVANHWRMNAKPFD